MQANQLFCDGGVIRNNPSTYGGMWAYRIVANGVVTAECAGLITNQQMRSPVGGVTNNQTELLALLEGLKVLPNDWVGTICSDSQCTLQRIFRQATWNNIPGWMHVVWQEQRKRLARFPEFDYVLLDGHPTRNQLAAGKGKRGHPVSLHNQWCDKACGKLAEAYLQKVR